ncbi:Histone-lysine N-methyltransferase ASHH2 [Bienertia sinuspersici]
MGPCELSSEPVCTSPPMFVADRAEELVDNAFSERFIEHSVEPLLSLDVSSPTSDVGGDDSVGHFVDQVHLCSNMGVGLGMSGNEDGNTICDCHVVADCDKHSDAAIEKDDIACADGPEVLVCDALGEKLHELNFVSHSGLDNSSQAPRGEKDTVLASSFEEGFRNLDHSFGTLEYRDGTTSDLCPSIAYIDTDNEPFSERQDVKHALSNNSTELGSAASIDCRLSRICLDGEHCESETNLFLTKLAAEDRHVASEKAEVVAPSSSAAQYVSHTNAGYDNSSGGSHVEVVCSETMGNGPVKNLVMPDTVAPSDGILAPKLTCAVESSNHTSSTGNNNAGTDGDMCELKCPDTCSLPLRRSSRSRKSVQQVESVKNSTKFTKKTSKVSLHRTIDFLSEATRKKRSSLSRSICSARWGVSENLSKYFKGSNMVAVNQVMDQRSRKKKEGRSRKKNKHKVSQFPEGRKEVPCRPIRLKVTFGKKEEPSKVNGMPPVVFEAIPGIQPCDDVEKLIFCSFNESSGGDVMNSSVPKEMPNLVPCSNSTSNVQLSGANAEICSVPGKSNHDYSSQLEFQKQDRSCADKLSDPGTSPDSEVIDQILDTNIPARALISLPNSVSKASCDDSCPRSESFPPSSKNRKNRRKKKDKLCQADNPVLECQQSSHRAKNSKKGGQLQKISNDFCGSANDLTANSENPQSNTSSSELVSTDLLPIADEVSHRALILDNGADNAYAKIINGIESADSGNSCQLLPPAEILGMRNSKGSRIKGKSRNKSKFTDVISRKKDKMKLTSKPDVSETSNNNLGEAYKIRGQSGTGYHDVIDVGKTASSNEVAFENSSCMDFIPTGIGKQSLAPRVAWVCCDDCLKWRCIPAELADAIEETNCRWTCKDNQDQTFADCAIPQEKSNAEINAELQISDEEEARDGHLASKSNGLRQSVALQPSTWMLIKSNLFLHRSRKDQTMDEIMVCHCKPPKDGSLGCGSQCLNRMLNIECVQGTCPCGDLCSNQQFQKRQYVMLSWFRCGKKGYGLQVLEDITESQFLIEYVGEVLDLQSYEARQKDYASKGHKHFYFMTLNGNEVIDASAKGNLGRFVNHSCDPNCRTEKGEELTFDYNYVRVFGAAAKKCHCGSPKCRGYIGGDPLNVDVIVQGDSDEEFPEPVVVKENGEVDHGLGDMMAKSSSLNVELLNRDNLTEEKSEVIVEAGEMIDRLESTIDDSRKMESVTEKDTIDESTDSSTGLRFENLKNEPIFVTPNQTSRAKHTIRTPTSSPKSDTLFVENTAQKFLSGSIDSIVKVSKVDVDHEPPHGRPHPRMKISRPSKSVKNRKSSDNSATVGKTHLTAHRSKFFSCKPKKLLEGSANGHLEAVEEKLNELLDADGGICKKKDASKGYLKLLLLTAASGDSGNGGAIQSNRDLSMILDAMLKTKSRGVLLDVINKNGLQMLHNMMKVYRRDFKKIPILRKLLKVHQIARNFRDRWIPYSLRKFHRMNKKDRRRDYRRGSSSIRYFATDHQWREQGAVVKERVSCSDQSGTISSPADARMQEASTSQLIDSQSIASRPRRRKSRWDQPARSPKKIRTSPKIEPSEGGPTLAIEAREDRDYSGAHNSDDDAPPGFSNPLDSVNHCPPGFSLSPKCPSVSVGVLQERFNPRMPVAYGIPISVVQQFGTLQSGTVDSWAVAPAMPFQPFPPLPPYPRDSRQTVEREEAGNQRDQGIPSTSGESLSSGVTNHNMLQHERGGRNFPGKRYYRQRKWSSSKPRPPWLRNLDGRGFKGNLGDVNHSVDYPGNSC